MDKHTKDEILRIHNLRGLRVCMDLSWWERLLETGNGPWPFTWRISMGERWEAINAKGEWQRFWRKGEIPDWAVERPPEEIRVFIDRKPVDLGPLESVEIVRTARGGVSTITRNHRPIPLEPGQVLEIGVVTQDMPILMIDRFVEDGGFAVDPATLLGRVAPRAHQEHTDVSLEGGGHGSDTTT